MVRYYEYRGLNILELDVSKPLTEEGNVIDDAKKLDQLVKLHRADNLFVIYNLGRYLISRTVLELAVKSIPMNKHKTNKRSIIVVGHDQKDRMIVIVRALKIAENTRVVETKDEAYEWFIHGDDKPDNDLVLK